MKKSLLLSFGILLFAILMITSCSVSYTTVATPKPTKQMLVTSGDLANKNYEVLGFVESTASEMGFGMPTEIKISEMKTKALNNGIVTKAESLGADAIINVSMATSSQATYFVLLTTNVFVKGTAIKFK
ncbi:MAG TPA: hypothetical protein DCQ31_14565 [Bacteroidales bacterium]|nr:hypothetical protein [Bacteroidales bacterium]